MSEGETRLPELTPDMHIGHIGMDVFKLNDKENVVILSGPPEGLKFAALQCACEYLIAVTALNSNAGFEKALEFLCEGAMKYKHLKAPAQPPREGGPDGKPAEDDHGPA